MSAQIIQLTRATANFTRLLFVFSHRPSLNEIIERQRVVENLLSTTIHQHTASHSPDSDLFFLVWEAHEFYWERCIDAGVNLNIIIEAMKKLGGDQYITKRVLAYANRKASLH